MKVLLTATVQSHICQFHKPLVEVLHKNGYEVHVAARDNLAEKNGLKLDFVDMTFDVPFSRSPQSADNLRAYRKLKRIIDEGHYDIIHCNTPMGGILTRIAAKKTRKSGTKVFYTAHGFHFYRGAAKKNWILFYPVEKFMSRLTDCVITISEEDYALAAQKFHCPVSHIHGVGINTSKYDAVTSEAVELVRQEHGWEDAFLILCTGELNNNKNQRTVIQAMPQVVKEIPSAKLLIAGNGPNKDALSSLIGTLHMEDSVELLGYRTDLEKYVHACDMVVSASFREGLPVNILEAMHCQKAVVASDNRGHRELVEDHRNGYLVDAGAAEQFSERIIELAKNEGLRRAMGEAGKKRSGAYTDLRVKEELKKIYED